MGETMRFESVSKEIIKPSSPTPQNLRTHKLSVIDQINPTIYIQILFFYSNTHEEGLLHLTTDDKLVRLKTSLSETLTHFYPLAGRVRDNTIVECNDEGAELWEVRLHGSLSDILKQPDSDTVQQLLTAGDGKGDGPLVKVQANVFDCGGMAIGVSLSHKISDISTVGSFLRAWWSTARGCMTEDMAPKFCLGSLCPSVDTFAIQQPIELKQFKCTTRRFMFDSSKIQKLRAKAKSNIVDNPSRVEAVTALIWKCAAVASRTNLGTTTTRPSKISQIVNIRKRLSPPLPETSVGNFAGQITVQEKQDNNNNYMELQDLVVQLRKGLEEYCKIHVPKFQQGNAYDAIYEGLKDMQLVFEEGLDLYYSCSSWCRSGLYEVDFGWGKPKWVGIPTLKFKNSIAMLDTSDGEGIEAWVNLSEEDMVIMETNQELLEFALVNHSVI